MRGNDRKRLVYTVALAFVSLSVLAITACSSSSGGGSDGACSCPAAIFLISVPADVASLTASGACGSADHIASDQYSVYENSVGTCHIAVTFKNGAPEYDTDVSLAHGTVGCETQCAPTPTAPVVIPDVDGGGAGGEGGGEGSAQ